MSIDIQIAESLIEAFNHQETGILLWNKNDKLIFRNKDMQNRFIKLDIPYVVGESFYDRLKKIKNKKLLSEKLIQERIKTYKKAKKTKKPQEYLVKGPTGRWIQIKDTLTPSGNVLTLMTNVTKIVEQEIEFRQLNNAIQELPNPVMIWDKNNKLVTANVEAKKRLQKNTGFALNKGVSRSKMLENAVNKGHVLPPKGMTKKQYLDLRKKEIENLKGQKTFQNTLKDGRITLISASKLSDGGSLQFFTDVSEFKKKEAELERLKKGIDILPNGLMFWGKDDQLIAHNDSAVSFLKNFGFKLKIGCHREDLTNHMQRKGYVKPNEGLTLEKHMNERRLAWKNFKGNRIRETKFTNGITLMFNETRLDDGSTITLWSDISEIKNRETKLKQLADAVDVMPNTFMLWDKHNNLVMANESSRNDQKKLGFDLKPGASRLEMVKNGVDRGVFIPPKGQTKKQFILERKKTFDKLIDEERREVEFSSGNFSLAISKRLPDGGTLQLVTNVTEIKKRETELKRLVDAVDNMPTQVILWDKDNNLLMANKEVKLKEKTLGLKFKTGINRLEIVKHSLSKGFLTTPPNMTKKQFLKERENDWANQKKLKEQRILENVYGDGSIFLVDTSILPDGASLQFFTDITKIKKRETELKQLVDAVDNMPNQVMLWDKDNKLIMANKTATSQNSSLGFDMKSGASRIGMVKHALEKGFLLPPENMTIKQFLESREEEFKTLKGRKTLTNFFGDGSVNLVSTARLPDGGTLQFFTDITEIKKKEIELKRLTDAIELTPSQIYLWGENDQLIMANKSSRNFQKKLGFDLKPGVTRRQMVATALKKKQIIPPRGIESKNWLNDRLSAYNKVEKESKFETRFANDITLLGITNRLDDGGFLQVWTDISDIKRKENDLQQLLDTIDQIPTIILLWDKDHKLIHSNEMAKSNAKSRLKIELKDGITRKEYVMHIINKGYLEVPKGMSKNQFIEEREKEINSLEGKQRYETTFTDGITFAGLFNKFPDGSYIQIFDDITDLKEKENIAKLAEKRLQDAIDSMPHGISLFDKDDVLVMNNKYARDIHKKAGIHNYIPGITFENQVNLWKENNFLKFENEIEKNVYYDKAFKNRKDFTGTRTMEVPQFFDNSYWSATYTRLDDNSVFSIFSNITELKNRENELRKTISQLDDEKEKANAANKTKSQFLANMSHELRTPLNAIIGLTEMLKEDATDDGLDDFVEPLDRVFNAGKHLLTLINDVLDLSKIEAGKIDLFNETFEFKPIIDDIIKTSEPLAIKNGNKLLLNFDNKIDQVTSDQTRIKQVILNLISNACKFTEKGTITLSTKKRNRTFVRNGRKISLGDLIVIEISDTGIGMTQEQMDRLFNSFVQADSSTTRKYGGTGLGLTISKQLAIMMGGDVSVKSVINEGTTFIFTFLADYRDASEDTKNKKATESSLIKNVVSLENQNTIQNKNAKTILVIDDDPTVSELIKRQLTKDVSYNVIIANNGKDGLKLAKQIKPNLITLDILMPEMDGWSVLRTLKADPEVSSIPVIMASILDEKNKGFSLGASDFVSKPIEKESLLNSIENLIGKSQNLKICLIEDDENLRFTIKELLQKQGNKVVEAKNGKVGIEVLKKEETLPDLILLDLMMPEMNGFEFLNEIKGTKYKSIPVLVLTGADLQDEDIKFLKGETEKVIQKTDDTVLSIAEEINKVMQTTG